MVRWLRPLGAVSGAFEELAKSFAGHAAIHHSLHTNTEDSGWSRVPQDSRQSTVPEGRGHGEGGEGSTPPTNYYDGVTASAAIYLGLPSEEVSDKTKHLLAIEHSIERYRQTIGTPDAVRRQIAANPMAWTHIRYDSLTFASAAAAREAADCIRLDGEAPMDVAARAGIAMEQATRLSGDLERPLAAILLSAGTNDWIGPVEIGGYHKLFRISGKIPPRPDDAMIVDRITTNLFTKTLERESRTRVRWRLQF